MKSMLFATVLGALATTIGCSQPDPAPQAAPETAPTASSNMLDHSVEGHSHGAGPHGGTIADWGGGKYHVEFTVDHEQQKATVYVLGPDEKTAVSIDSESIELSIAEPELQLILSPEPQASDPEGKSSRYVGTHEKLGVVQEYAGTMTAVIDGTPYSGDFSERSHDDHIVR
jgi:hypothetical protein